MDTRFKERAKFLLLRMQVLLEKNRFMFEDNDNELGSLRLKAVGEFNPESSSFGAGDQYSKGVVNETLQDKYHEHHEIENAEIVECGNCSIYEIISKVFVIFNEHDEIIHHYEPSSVDYVELEKDNHAESSDGEFIESEFSDQKIGDEIPVTKIEEISEPSDNEEDNVTKSGSDSEIEDNVIESEPESGSGSEPKSEPESGSEPKSEPESEPESGSEFEPESGSGSKSEDFQGNADKGNTSNRLTENSVNHVTLWVAGIFLFCCVLTYFIYKSMFNNSDSEKLPVGDGTQPAIDELFDFSEEWNSLNKKIKILIWCTDLIWIISLWANIVHLNSTWQASFKYNLSKVFFRLCRPREKSCIDSRERPQSKIGTQLKICRIPTE